MASSTASLASSAPLLEGPHSRMWPFFFHAPGLNVANIGGPPAIAVMTVVLSVSRVTVSVLPSIAIVTALWIRTTLPRCATRERASA